MTSFTHPVVHAVPAGAIVSIAVASIKASDTNPRRIFDGIEELAESIKASGLLQPLVVRPNGKAGSYELIAGERRWRALKLAKIETAQCKVLNVDDGQALEAQIVENLQREDVTPLEEAEGFKRLQDKDPKKYTPQAIAKAVGKTDRFVQQRLAIANNLAPAFKAKLKAGKLTVEAARVLAGVPVSLQAKLPTWAHERSADEIRRRLLDMVIPVSTAAFDATTYKGELVEEGSKKYFADVAQFEKLQRAAAQSIVDKMRAGLWKTAKLIDDSDISDYVWGDTLERVWRHQPKAKSTGKAKVGVDKLTAIVWIEDDYKVRQATGVVPAGAVPQRAGGSRNSSMPARETAAQRRSRMDFSARLVKAVADKADTGARVLLTAFVGTYGARTTYDGNATQKMCESFLPPALASIVKGGGGYGDRAPRVWKIVKAMKLVDVQRAIAGYGALAFIWDSQDGRKPTGLTATLGDLLKVKPREVLPPTKPKPDPKATAKAKAVKKKKGTL